MNPVAQIPEWLTAAWSTPYLSFVLKTLAMRERIRDNARSMSRRQDSPPRRGLSRLVSFNRTVKPGLPAQYSVCVGCQPENVHYNRYYQLEPYDRTRVIVAEEEGSGGRYLNANWVLERSGHKWWIATQAPLPNTAHAFLTLILKASASPPPEMLENANSLPPRSRIRTVVQLTQNFEGGRRKAHAYFPSEVGKSLVVTPEEGCTSAALKVTLLDTRRFDEANCVQSTVSVVPVKLPESSPSAHHRASSKEETNIDDEDYGEEISSQRVVFRHMLYASWPDHGVPSEEDRASLVSFARLVDEVNRDTSIESQSDTTAVDPDPPIMVGCSAGIGRTGSFIAISSLLRLMGQLPPPAAPTPATVLPASPLDPLPDQLANDHVVQEVDFMREQRPGMVQRDEQVLFIYQTLAIALGAT